MTTNTWKEATGYLEGAQGSCCGLGGARLQLSSVLYHLFDLGHFAEHLYASVPQL